MVGQTNNIGVAEKEQEILKIIPQRYLEFIKEMQKYESKVIYAFLVVLGFLSYTLAYVFLYGYYFGGRAGNIMSVLEVIINPVPFNFKSLLIVGVYLIIIMFIFISFIIKISATLNNKSKQIIFDVILLFLIVVSILMTLVVFFIGKVEFDTQYMQLFGFILFVVMFNALSYAGKFSEMIVGLFGGIFSVFIIIIISLIKRTEFPTAFYAYFLIYTSILLSVLLIYFNIKKLIIFLNIFLVIYISAGGIMNFTVFSIQSLTTILVTIILLTFIHIVWIKVGGRISKNRITTKHKTKKANLKFINVGLGRNKYTILAILIISFIAYIYYLIFSFGQDLGKSMDRRHLNEITYYIGENPESLTGNVVSHKDDIFYISNENRELVIIKASEVKSIIKNTIMQK